MRLTFCTSLPAMSYEDKLRTIESICHGFPENNTALTKSVFADLVLAKKWKHVECMRVEGLQMGVLLAYEPENRVDQLVIIPILQDSDTLSMKRIGEMFEAIDNAEGMSSVSLKKITLAIYSSDSTIVYYHINKGLTKPTQRNQK